MKPYSIIKQGKYRHELPPHIFALAEEAYRAVKNDKENQCVIIRYVLMSS